MFFHGDFQVVNLNKGFQKTKLEQVLMFLLTNPGVNPQFAFLTFLAKGLSERICFWPRAFRGGFLLVSYFLAASWQFLVILAIVAECSRKLKGSVRPRI